MSLVLHPAIYVMLVLSGCGPSNYFETFDEDVQRYCSFAFECIEVEMPDRQYAYCIDNMKEQKDVALDEGDACAEVYANAVACVATIDDCTERDSWSLHRKELTTTVEYQCKQEMREFYGRCDKTWGASGVD